MISRSTLALIFALPLSASAHEGHGLITAQNALHYLTDPLHLAPVLLIAACAWWAVRRRPSKRS